MSEPTEFTVEVRSHAEVVQILVDAVNAAHAKRIPIIASTDRGVTCISTHANERWARRPGRGLSPVGAVILDRQPRAMEADEAACEALGVSYAWLIGFEAGCGGELPHASWE